jgi:hypothetical protein
MIGGWRALSERIRTASEIPIEVDLTDIDAALHLRRLGMTYPNIAERLGINPWMAKKAARWGKSQTGKGETAVVTITAR